MVGFGGVGVGQVSPLNPLGMVTVTKWKYPVARVSIRGLKCGQCTWRCPVNTFQKLSLNSVLTSLIEASGIPDWI